MPTPAMVHENRLTGRFGTFLNDPNLWHLNRRSVAGAFAVGFFVMFLPPLGHVLIAGALAIYLRVNLPISVTLVWISNPVTIPAMYYLAYVVGCWILDIPAAGFSAQFWLDWHNWLGILKPLLIGCLVCGAISSLLGYFAIQILWRWKLVRQINKRRERYRAMAASRVSTPSSNRQT